ncbi:antitoxin VbhA family protein [Sphingomonas sp. PAMC 26605]|uniref:antitoxin VbhA family protein n=1 Tax=Sphingomonas sp. PAMC 26605 TaxID=1112214 RepID=UPI00026CDE60|nr:antitoxin VbhA family protein [Sphingomonas sp. PAMC 26605]
MSDPYDSVPWISAEERDRRQRAIDFARGSLRFEGLIPSQEGERIAQKFIAGELTMAQAIEAVEALR